MIQEDRLVKLFLDLVAINAPALQEAECVAWTRQYLQQISGLEIWEDDAAQQLGGNANNLIAKLPGTLPNAPRIFLSAHFDTVEPTAGLVVEEVEGVFRSASDTILGADDKGGMAPAIEAIQALVESGEPHGDVYLLFSVAEEIGLRGAAALKIEELNLDFGYVLDTGPPVGSFVTRTATHDKLDVKLIGKPAHSGKDPENGVNAIAMLAEAVHNMRLGRIDAETTANLGLVEGGTAVNVVCPSVRVRGEARSMNEATLDAQIAHMKDCFTAAAAKFGGEAEITYGRHYRSFTLADDAPVVQVALAAAKARGLTPKLRTNLGGSDANVYNAKGIPSVVVATGMDKIHTHEERMSRADLVETAHLTLELIRAAAKQNR